MSCESGVTSVKRPGLPFEVLMNHRPSSRRSRRRSTPFLGVAGAHRAIGALAAAMAAMVVLPGCHKYSTEIRVKDPSDVGLYAGKTNGASSQVVVPPGKQATTVDYPVFATAYRESTGALRLTCAMCGPDGLMLVDASGVFLPIEAPAGGMVSPEARARANLEAWQSVKITYSSYTVGNTARTETTSILPVLKTPWTNVVEIKERRTPQRDGAWAELALGVISTGCGWLLWTMLPATATGGRALAMTSIGVGLVLDLHGAYQAFFPSIAKDLYPAGK
jgi:hypothetical protein